MLLHQTLALGLQLGDFGIEVLDLLLDVVMVLLQQLPCFFKVGSRWRRTA